MSNADNASMSGQKTQTLTANDRCDSCGARAYVRVEFRLVGGKIGDLMFCGHHFSMYQGKLEASASSILNETSLINGQPVRRKRPARVR